MSTTGTTFRRHEKKYIMDKKKLGPLMGQIGSHMEPDRFYRYTISNIYYDTENYELIRRSIQKPVYKEKLRIRTYGDLSEGGKLFFELKKKYKKEVFKRRVPMNESELRDYLDAGSCPENCRQVLDEIGYFMSVYNPQPKIFIAYERSAFTGKQDPDLRITFDENIRFRTDNLDFMHGNCGAEILGGSKIIMEVKTRSSIPLWLSGALNGLGIYPDSFSKYGHCYENYILQGAAIGAVNIPANGISA